MKTIALEKNEIFSESYLDRKSAFNSDALAAAQEIVEEVRTNGDTAVRAFTKKFDGVELKKAKIDVAQIEDSLYKVNPRLIDSLRHAFSQIYEYHEKQKKNSWFMTRENGALLGEKVTPLSSVGIYVPGGRAQYPSTVLMNAIPAKVAGVTRVVMCTPPNKDGEISAQTLAAACIAGVDEIYAIGGAQSIAAMAYGTDEIEKVDKITGPGNAFVAAAKKIVMGDVGIDMIAGPSEVCVYADEGANPKEIAIDLMAQAEHDPLATSYFVTESQDLISCVKKEIVLFLEKSPRKEITQKSLDNNGLIVLVNSRDQALQAINVIAPEHLELQINDPQSVLANVNNAGAIFVGRYSTEALGDYLAGPNHTLPTGGTARFSSPLHVDDFVRRTSIINYSKQAFDEDAKHIEVLADAEGLWSHGMSATVRM